MYPFIRLGKEMFVARSQPRLGLWDTHVSRHRCWPWDIDMWMELNNGRTLTLFDLGRVPLAQRVGLVDVLRREKWALTLAGATVRYRRRIRPMEVIEMRSRAIGFDARFMYLEQSMWKADGACANHALYRGAVTDRNGIVPSERVFAAMGLPMPDRPLPAFARTWIEAEAERPWPPMSEADDAPPSAPRAAAAGGK